MATSGRPASPALALDEIQGNIVPGFNKDHQAFVAVGFPDQSAGLEWLHRLRDEIASAQQCFAFKQLLKLDKRPRSSSPFITARWTNVALSFAGMQQLVPRAELQALPVTFKNAHVPLTEPMQNAHNVHALLLLAADRPDDLAFDLVRHMELLAHCGIQHVRTFRGDNLPGADHGHEHFGFKDGISQPVLAGTPDAEGSKEPLVAPGEFIVGEPNAANRVTMNGPPWTRGGSYLAFVQLQQDVGAFRSAVSREAERLRATPESVGAAIVGRCRNGSDTNKPPSPLSHSGRAHPRQLGAAEVAKHRLLRRGIPYGPPFDTDSDDNRERGLLFVSYQADLAAQFEHVWQRWLNGTTLPGSGVVVGADALSGQAGGNATRRATISEPRRPNGGGVGVTLPRFVIPRYGGYFFAPSIPAICRLAETGRR